MRRRFWSRTVSTTVSRGGETFVVKGAPDFELMTQNSLAGDPGPFNRSPAVVDGKLLLRSDRFLHGIGEE